MQDRRLCVLNAGSSSLKFAVYGVADSTLRRLQSGEVEKIGGEGRLLIATADGKPTHDSMVNTKDHAAALAMLAAIPDGPLEKQGLMAFGHRVVHGGPDLDAPVVVDATTLAQIEALEPLAPLHNPPAVAVLKALSELFPGLPHVACFDTAFHRGHPAVADRFAIPDALYREGVRRYGFHGLSYEYIAGALAERAPEIALGRIVVAHLGSGASMCALVGGRSVELVDDIHGIGWRADGDSTGIDRRRRDPLAAAAEGLGGRSGGTFSLCRLRAEGDVGRVQ